MLNSFPLGYQCATTLPNTATLIPIIQSQNQIAIVNNPVKQLIQLQMPTPNSYNNMPNNLNNMHLSNQQSIFASNTPNMFITTPISVVPVSNNISDLSTMSMHSQPSTPSNKTMIPVLPDVNCKQQYISPSSVISNKSNKVNLNAFKSPSPLPPLLNGNNPFSTSIPNNTAPSPPPSVSNNQAPLPPPLNRNNPFSTSLNEKYRSAMRMRLYNITSSSSSNDNARNKTVVTLSLDDLDQLLNLCNSLEKKDTQKQCKSYSCKYCNKSFNFKKDCSKHQITHSGSCPYHCYCCNKSFASKLRLEAHQQSHNIVNIKTGYGGSI